MHKEIATAVVVPGWAARMRRRPFAFVVFVVGVLLPAGLLAYVVLTDRNRVALSLDTTFLGAVIVAGIAAIAARVAALAEVWVAADRRTSLSRAEAITSVGATALLIVGVLVVVEVSQARAAIGPTFEAAGGEVLFDVDRTFATTTTVETRPTVVEAASTTVPVDDDDAEERPEPTLVVVASSTTSTVPPRPSRPDSGVTAAQLAGVTSVLLIGGDAGPGRSGLRTDSMMLFSLHLPSGRASLVSVPRNLERLLFPPGSAMEARYPYGYTGIANAVYPTVSSRNDLRAA